MLKLKLLLLTLCWPLLATASILTDKLEGISAISGITPLANTAGFAEKYVMKFNHPLNYNGKDAGRFDQRVFVCHVGFDKPTVVVTEGYWATYAERAAYREELSQMLDANLVVCEYRYFAESTPQGCDWNYLTVENSLNDLHEVVTALKAIYPKKWLATGISKGGQTTMFYRAYFPNDVDVSVPYVAPLNKKLEDGRHEPFIANTPGTAADRAAVQQFQMDYFKRKAGIMPYFTTLSRNANYKYNAPFEDIYDYWILEYSFAFWQWGTPVTDIPDTRKMTDKQMAEYMFQFNDPSYFQCPSQFLSFNVQAAKELGYYGYDIKPFKPYMSVKSTKNYLHRLMIPAEVESSLKFSNALYKKTVNFLKHNDPKMVYIYGEYDPWSASGVCTWLNTHKKENIKIYVLPGGSHKARIGNMPENTKQEIVNLIKGWME